jgi:hypothetical protein
MLALMAVLSGAVSPATIAQAATTVSGTVYQDFNGNGIRNQGSTVANTNPIYQTRLAEDTGIAGVLVTAYDAAGAVVGSTTSLANGSYSLTLPDPAPYRLEFSNLPSGYQPSAQGTDNGTTIRFVSASTTNLDFGINYAGDYCQDNPLLVTNCYQFGNQLVANISGMPDSTTKPTIYSFNYNSGATSTAVVTTQYDSPTPGTVAQAQQVGPTWGIVYARQTKTIYASAFMKRHVGFGPGGPGAIYKLDPATQTVLATYNIPTVTNNPHTTTNNYLRDNDDVSFDAVGKAALGGLALSEDEQTLYTVDLETRRIYALDPTSNTTIVLNSAVIPTTGYKLQASAPRAECAASDVRPFALKFYRGALYIGVMCTAESSTTVDTFVDGSNNCPANGFYDVSFGPAGVNRCGVSAALGAVGEAFVDNDGNGVYNRGDTRELHAYVYQVNLATLTFNPATPILQFPLNYPRDRAAADLGVNFNTVVQAHWNPWISTFANLPPGQSNFTPRNPNYNFPVYPQPWLVDLEFDVAGRLLLGFRDRYSDQVGHGSFSNPNDPGSTLPTAYFGIGSGDMLLACLNSSNVWVLENNGSCGSITTAGANNQQGPGGGEFYYQEDLRPNHDELSLGGMLQIPGYPESVNTEIDPIRINTSDAYFDVGFRWYDNSNGQLTKAYRLVNGQANGTQAQIVASFGKAGGLGDLLALCDLAPIEIGNRVWIDTDNDGVQDPDEPPIVGVEVEIVNSLGTVIGVATTDAQGRYYFSNDTRRTSTANAIYGLTSLIFGETYTVRIALQQPELNTLFVTQTNNDTTGNGDSRDSDGDNENAAAGMSAPATAYTQVVISIGQPGDNNHTYDFGFSLAPTAISLVKFAAERSNNRTILNWVTSAEINSYGFELYRSDDGTWENAQLLNQQIIAATGGSLGRSYQWFDSGEAPTSTTRYWLIERDINGIETRYGPIAVTPNLSGLPFRIYFPRLTGP